MDIWEFMQSWTFMAIMAGLLCLLIVSIPVGIVILVLWINRAKREDREKRE
jgi:hypothetical protein